MLDWDSNQESLSEDLDYEANVDIDGPDHIEDYLDQWWGRSPHHIGIHNIDLGEDEGADEDTGNTQTRWNTFYTSSGWDENYSSTYAHEYSQDAGHENNEETDLDQDDYEPK